MGRDQARSKVAEAGITADTVTDDQLKTLRRLINKHLKASGIYNGTARLRRARKDMKFIEMQTNQWECREAVSFNRDGFIGIAGWADKRNVRPLVEAVAEWAALH